MKQIFTKQFMQDNCGCYSIEQLNACSFMKTEPVTLKSIIDSEIPLKDKFWFICRKVATKKENQQIAVRCAEIVLPIYEQKYPNDNRVRNCIEATKKYLTGEIDLPQLKIKRVAAASAADAAATYAAAYAADADDADTAAAYADAAAAYADAAASAADTYKMQLIELLNSFVLENQTT